MAEAGNNGRDTAGRFAAGNPGRQPGSLNVASRLAAKLLAGEAQAITRRLIEAALDKTDPAHPIALKLTVERLLPPARHQPTLKGVEVPAMDGAKDLPMVTAAILRAVLDHTTTRWPTWCLRSRSSR